MTFREVFDKAEKIIVKLCFRQQTPYPLAARMDVWATA
jgi:hypothetical protein